MAGSVAGAATNTPFLTETGTGLDLLSRGFAIPATIQSQMPDVLKGASVAKNVLGLGADAARFTPIASAVTPAALTQAGRAATASAAGAGEVAPFADVALENLSEIAGPLAFALGIVPATQSPEAFRDFALTTGGAAVGGPIGAAAGFALSKIFGGGTEKGLLGFGGKKTLAQRQAEERIFQAQRREGIRTGLVDVLTPNQGLDIAGIDIGKVADLTPDQILASLDRANDVLWHQDWAQAGNDPLPPQGDVAQGQLYMKMLGLQDELAKRGLAADKIPAIIFGPKELRNLKPFEDPTFSEGSFGIRPGARDAQNRQQGASEEVWTAAQALAWMNPAIDAEWARWKIQKEGGLAPLGQRAAQINRILASVPQGPANSRMEDVKQRLYAMDQGQPTGGDFAAAGLTEAEARDITGIGLPQWSQRQVDAFLASLSAEQRERFMTNQDPSAETMAKFAEVMKRIGTMPVSGLYGGAAVAQV